MTKDDVEREIKTPAVIRAFDLAKISQLPKDVRAAYQIEEMKFEKYSEYASRLVDEE